MAVLAQRAAGVRANRRQLRRVLHNSIDDSAQPTLMLKPEIDDVGRVSTKPDNPTSRRTWNQPVEREQAKLAPTAAIARTRSPMPTDKKRSAAALSIKAPMARAANP